MASSYIQTLEFKLKVFESSGNAFQDLFAKVMGYTYQDFTKISVFHGDGGNDGYIPSDGWYFQVYAPEILTSKDRIEKSAAVKIPKDLKKLIQHWDPICQVKKYSFVYNDRFRGIPAPIITALQDLDRNNVNITIEGFDSQRLLDYFMNLNDKQKSDIVGFCPDLTTYYGLDNNILAKLLFSIVDQYRGELLLDQQPYAPDFKAKLDYNKFSPGIKDLLRFRARETSYINDFFAKSPDDDQTVANAINCLYKQSMEIIPDEVEACQDLRFMWIRQYIIPETLRNEIDNDKIKATAFYNAADMIIAKYFESCDVFESPLGLDSE